MHTNSVRSVLSVLGAAAALVAASTASAQVQLRVTVQNMAPANSIAYAPLRVGFHSGVYDSFNTGMAASNAIISIAEGGSGSAWFPAFAAADPTATLGTVVPSPAGPLLPGASASAVFNIDPSINRYFSFASMVVPSNDHFIGNDDPMQYMILDTQGHLLINSISQFGRDIWNAGSEATDPANAAFLVGGNNDTRTPENGVVRNEFAELDAFNGLTTAAGYVFNRQFSAGDEVYRISFELVPAPGAATVLAMGGLFAARRRR